MKKLFTVMLLAAVCLGAAAQESKLLDNWEDKIDLNDSEVLAPVTYMSFFYNFDFGALNQEGLSQHGWGLEVATLFLGFKTWRGAYLSLGLLDFCMDMSYLNKGYLNSFNQNANNPAIIPFNVKDPALAAETATWTDINGSCTKLAFLFPLTFSQEFGDAKIALMAAPGIGFNTYKNEFLEDTVRHKSTLQFDKKNAYFRLNLSAYFWYSHFGLGVRYSFPPKFQGPGVLSVGISIGL